MCPWSKLLKADAGHGDSLNHCAPIYRRVTQCDISASCDDDAPDALIQCIKQFSVPDLLSGPDQPGFLPAQTG